MSVLVNEDANIQSLADLKGKHLCHPGFDEGEAGIKSSNLITEVSRFISNSNFISKIQSVYNC